MDNKTKKTTIAISKEAMEALKGMKLTKRETYDEVIIRSAKHPNSQLQKIRDLMK